MSNTYEIYYETDGKSKLNRKIREVFKGHNIFIVTDNNVNKLHGSLLAGQLKEFDIKFICIKNKSFKSYKKLITFLLKEGFKKSDLLVSFGGGTVGDLTAFVASTIYRGVKYIQIPTTLLAQVDSSIGSKTAIDTKFGKNLIGTFYDPALVYINTDYLQSLSTSEYNNGFAESIKMALLFDYNFYNKIKIQDKLTVQDIKKIVNMKKEVVIKDPFDVASRRLLNFGHTFGHVIEKTNNYKKFSHGEAISHGMVMSIDVGIRMGLTNPKIKEDVIKSLSSKGLLSKKVKDYKYYLEGIKFDKKTDLNGLNFIILTDIAMPKIVLYNGE